MRRNLTNGFTLIELSIVLVIVALIAGGIVVGRAMIDNAANQRMIADIDRIKTAINTFRLKYNCLPGDCANATSFMQLAAIEYPGGNENSPNGNGNGRYDRWPEGHVRLWEHLSVAGLLDTHINATIGAGNWTVPGTTVPDFRWLQGRGFFDSSSVNLTATVSDGWVCTLNSVAGCEDSQNHVVNGVTNTGMRMVVIGVYSTGAPSPFSGGFRCSLAYALDSKIDDRMPAAGKVRAWGHPHAWRNCLNINIDTNPLLPTTPYASTDPNVRASSLSFGF